MSLRPRSPTCLRDVYGQITAGNTPLGFTGLSKLLASLLIDDNDPVEVLDALSVGVLASMRQAAERREAILHEGSKSLQ